MLAGQTTAASLVEVKNLGISFDTSYGTVDALDNVSLTIYKNEIICLVGESGCGKSTFGLSLIGLLPTPPARISHGEVFFKGSRIVSAEEGQESSEDTRRRTRGTEVFMIFQEPMTSLNPVLTIEDQLGEAARIRDERQKEGGKIKRSKEAIWEELVSSLEQVKIADPSRILKGYPHQLSGGMRQRIMISMALLLKPSLLIADEPTTALDVTTQDQIIKLIKELVASKLGTSVLFITHDLTLAKSFAQKIAVMYAGEIVELGTVDEVLIRPKHPYTQALLACLPRIQKKEGALQTIPGRVPELIGKVVGCKFRNRCQFAMHRCGEENPPFYSVAEDPKDSTRTVRCFLYD